MRFRSLPALAGVFVCLWTVSSPSQTRVLPQVSFVGANGYSQAELLAFTGLRPGSSATQQQLEDAAQRLSDTGLFEEVNFAGNDRGIIYTLKPAPAESMLPANFGNFVWWQDDEIERTLQAKVPLYHAGSVPTNGKMRETIAAALTAMLAEKSIAGAAVTSLPGSSQTHGPLDRIVFRIVSPPVTIRSLTLRGASAEMQPQLAAVVHDITGQQWDKNDSAVNITARVEDVYRNLGYLDIAVANPERSAPVITAAGIEVDATAALTEGTQYHVTRLDWPGSEFLSTAEFTKQAKLKPGDPDSPAALRESLKSLTTAYGARGYIDAEILAPPAIDRAAHQVSYTVSVVPGPQYRFHSVQWPTLSGSLASEFQSLWKMKPGDVYDSTYVLTFLRQNAAELVKEGYTPEFSVKKNKEALTVDLTVVFTRGPKT